MGFLSRVSTVRAPSRYAAVPGALDPFWYTPEGWIGQLTAAGVPVSPELALTLSAVYCATLTITDDISTMPPHLFRRLDDGGRARSPRYRGLERLLRWQPNVWQTSKEFWGCMVGCQLLRGWGIAEKVLGPDGEIAQLVPRHPDRVKASRLPSGRLSYRFLGLRDEDGQPKTLSQDRVFVLRDWSLDGITPVSRIAYGLQSMGAALAQEKYTQTFFKKGATASIVLSYKGEMDEEEQATLHNTMTRYIGGAENAGGILLIEEDVLSIEKLGIEPEKAQLLGSREFAIREVARWFKMPGHKLESQMQTQAYAAREAANLEYVIGCLRPIVYGAELAMWRDLLSVDDQEEYYIEFLMEALLRGDTKTRADYYERAIRNRWMNPNEVRVKENMEPYENGDEYAPWNTATAARQGNTDEPRDAQARRVGPGRQASQVEYRGMLLAHEAAQRVIRKEVAAVTALAKRHATDAETWQRELRTFYDGHAQYTAETLRIPLPVAREYAARHGTLVADHGVAMMGDWAWTETSELGMLALDLADAA